jgi:hypothetical protein
VCGVNFSSEGLVMTKLFVPAYWPLFKTHELRRFDYHAPETPSFTSVFSYDVGSDSMLYNNYDPAGKWLNVWYYQYRTGFGIAEWRDDYPGNKKVVLSPPIGWGEFQDVGSVYQNKPKFDFFKCWPPAFSNGDQIVVYEQHLSAFTACAVTYTDVIQFSYLQAWDGKPATGARYWMALGIGPVAVSFLTQDATDPKKITESVRWDAVVTRVNA